MEEVYVVKSKLAKYIPLTTFTHKFDNKMKKYVLVLNAIELQKQLMDGKRVEGVLYTDRNTGKLTFKAYNRQPRCREKDCMIKKLPWGWVKVSQQRFKVFASLPKEVGLTKAMSLLDEHTREAKDALIDRELDIIEFC